eukprot:758469-Hanusia_phi.AAC.3
MLPLSFRAPHQTSEAFPQQPTLSQDHEATAGGRGRTSTAQGQGTGPATNPPSSHSEDVGAKGSGEDWMKTKEKKWEDWMPIPGGHQ